MVTHVRWCVNVTKWKPTKDDWLALTSSIARDELERINKFQFQDDSKSSLIGCALIRKFISQVTTTPSNQLVLTRNHYGRPEICKEYLATQMNWPKRISFNVSHSGDFCVLAGFSSQDEQLDVKIGVDVTRIIRKSGPDLVRFLDLMKRREFTPGEWETVETVEGERQKCINFTRLWCLKESYIKAIGMGLSFRLNRIDFRFPKHRRYHMDVDILRKGFIDDTTVFLDGEPATNWRFYLTALDDEHLVALAHKFESPIEYKLDCADYFEELPVRSIVDSLTPVFDADEANWNHFSSRSVKTFH